MNASEGVWARLRQILNETAPTGRETRQVFVKRLRRSAQKLNQRYRKDLLILCTNQKVRAREVLERGGATTKW